MIFDVRVYKVSMESPGYTALDITAHVSEVVREAGLQKGLAVVYSAEEDCAVIEIEYEPNLLLDLETFLKRIGCVDARVCDIVLGRSAVIPVVNISLFLGQFKNVVFVDLSKKPGNKSLVVVLEGIFKDD